MGIKHLRKAIRRYAPDAETVVTSLAQFKDRGVAVDSMIFCWKARATQTQVDHYFAAMTRDMQKHNIRGVFVWDGQPLDLKSEEVGKRRKRADELDARQSRRIAEATKELDELRHDVAVGRLDFSTTCMKRRRISELESVIARPSRASLVPTRDDKLKAMEVVKAAGFTNVTASHEGEQACAMMCMSGDVDVVFSEDLDVLPFGGNLLTGYTPLSQSKPLLHYNLSSVLSSMKMTRQQFVYYCILCGCDFCPSIRGVGMVNAYNLLRKYSSIENILTFTRFEPEPGFVDRYASAASVFMNTLSDDVCTPTTTAPAPAHASKDERTCKARA